MAAADISLERPLPHSLESERAVLGAILLDDKVILPATEILTAEDFYLEQHREIFRAMLGLAGEDTSIDLFTLREELRRRNKEEAAGGLAYIAALTEGVPRKLNVGHYARTVREKATARQLIQLSNEMMCRCYEGEERPAEILEKAESRIFQIAARGIKGGFQPARELAAEAHGEIEQAANNRKLVTGIDTGFVELNRMTGGPQRQNLVVVAARPGLGKTSFCLNIACHAALRQGRKVGIFSLEMAKPEVMKRMISSESEVDPHRIRSGYLSREDWGKIFSATSDLTSAGIFVDDSANLTMLQVRAKAQRLAMKVFGSRRYENRTLEVTEISRGLKNLAKELDIPVIAASQLNREIERRG